MLLSATQFVVICYSTHRKLYSFTQSVGCILGAGGSYELKYGDDVFLGRSHWLLCRNLAVRDQEWEATRGQGGGPSSGHLHGSGAVDLGRVDRCPHYPGLGWIGHMPDRSQSVEESPMFLVLSWGGE